MLATLLSQEGYLLEYCKLGEWLVPKMAREVPQHITIRAIT